MNLHRFGRYYTVMGSSTVTVARWAAGASDRLAGTGLAAANPSHQTRAARGWDGGEEEAVTIDPAAGRDDAEALLLQRIAGGDRLALGELYSRYARQLFAFLGRLAPDAATTEELVQDTLLAVWRSAASFQRRSTARTWIYAVARRQAHNRLRRLTLTLVELDQAPALVDAAGGPEEQALATADRERLAGLLARLSVVHREALVLFFIDELTHAEMAEILDVPVGTVKSRLSNGRAALARLATAKGAPS